ncbi:hypothetical protein [Oceanicoccus sagamiensis]|uniref:Uncharacterized protein n=1 Tax=Oceanicoccus sagamiensis TaxID=716816 RepID=A0A1X9N6P2_9GAMM|nr:hypothetical protein [Oceanicoccus sagamiensis]ARN73770.1 hypothetical protein BST96_06365 [Oceanicoccus sagamiensis]
MESKPKTLSPIKLKPLPSLKTGSHLQTVKADKPNKPQIPLSPLVVDDTLEPHCYIKGYN